MGNAKTDAKSRQRLRRRLRAEGIAPHEIDQRVAVLARRQLAARGSGAPMRPQPVSYQERSRRPAPPPESARYLERLQAETYARFDLKDSGYRPGKTDKLLTGAARATGETAAVVRRRATMTRWQYDERQEKGS